VNLLWLLVIIPGVAWSAGMALAGVAGLWSLAVGMALVGDDFWWDRFPGQLGVALLWPAWCWRRR
jgi:hypothetical protein